MESFRVQFLGSVEVPYHQGNGILCAAMQKVQSAGNITKQTARLQSRTNMVAFADRDGEEEDGASSSSVYLRAGNKPAGSQTGHEFGRRVRLFRGGERKTLEMRYGNAENAHSNTSSVHLTYFKTDSGYIIHFIK